MQAEQRMCRCGHTAGQHAYGGLETLVFPPVQIHRFGGCIADVDACGCERFQEGMR